MMVKKFFALSLIAAALTVAGCSSDDDDDTGSTDAGTVDAGTVDAGTVDAGTVDAGTVDAGTTDGSTETPVEDTSTMTGTSILDLARGTDDGAGTTTDGVADLSDLVALIGDGNYNALLNMLDDEAGSLTVFAPSNAALTAAGIDTTDTAAVENTLSYHVVSGTELNTSALVGDEVFPMTLTTEQGGELTIRDDGTGAFEIVDAADPEAPVALTTAVTAENGVVYVIEQVLVAPPAPVVDTGGETGGDTGAGTDTGTTDGGAAGAAGSAYAAIQANADLSSFEALVDSSNFANSLQDANNNHFITFAPKNGSIDAAITTAVAYVVSSRAAGVSGEAAPGDYRGTGDQGLDFTLAGAAETLTVNGSPATFVATESGGALYVYGE